MTLHKNNNRSPLYNEVQRVLFERGWEDLESVAEWDGQDVEDLRRILTEEQFETLLEELEGLEDLRE